MEIELTAAFGEAGDIEDEFNQLIREIGKKTQSALRHVALEMREDLKRHIDEEVYEKYTPKVYPRRKDNPGFGIPLNDMEHNASGYAHFTDGLDNGISFLYQPDGSHSGTTADLKPNSKYYNADNPRPIKPNPVHGDDLIQRIETGKGYDWDVHVGRRPFWTHFKQEQLNSKMEENFIAGMREAGEMDIVADGGVQEEDGDE